MQRAEVQDPLVHRRRRIPEVELPERMLDLRQHFGLILQESVGDRTVMSGVRRSADAPTGAAHAVPDSNTCVSFRYRLAHARCWRTELEATRSRYRLPHSYLRYNSAIDRRPQSRPARKPAFQPPRRTP
eukprot:1035720-Rhodomonas_salina.2